MASVFISGVSDGIGLALATLYLQKGDTVIGMARHCPEQIAGHENFVLIQADFGCLTLLSEVIDTHYTVLENAEFDTLYLNAGVTGNAPEYAGNTQLHDVVTVMNINAISNKLLLDALLNMKHKPALVVVSASIAGRRYRAGMLAYSMSKAALEALSGVYAQEFPDVFFAVLGMCNVDTRLSNNIVNHPNVSLFPDHARLKQRFRVPGYVVSAEKRAEDIYKIVQEQNCKHLKNGEFIEVRTLLNSF